MAEARGTPGARESRSPWPTPVQYVAGRESRPGPGGPMTSPPRVVVSFRRQDHPSWRRSPKFRPPAAVGADHAPTSSAPPTRVRRCCASHSDRRGAADRLKQPEVEPGRVTLQALAAVPCVPPFPLHHPTPTDEGSAPPCRPRRRPPARAAHPAGLAFESDLNGPTVGRFAASYAIEFPDDQRESRRAAA